MTKPHKPRIVFFGNERLATGVTTNAPVLRALLQNGYEVAALVLHHREATSRTSRQAEIIDVAQSNGIPVLMPDKLADAEQELRHLHADIGVLAAYGKIVPRHIIDVFPHGIVNIHPSALPKHRGPTPIESVLLSGETETAVSIMRLVSAMDAGPLFAQQAIQLRGDETKQKLADTLSAVGAALLLDNMPAIIDGSLQPQPQNDKQATYDRLITKQDGLIDWHKPAERLEREVRAYAGWPKSYGRIASIESIITTARVADSGMPDIVNKKPGDTLVASNNSELFMVCGQGTALQILRLKPAGKADMPAPSFINGYGKIIGL